MTTENRPKTANAMAATTAKAARRWGAVQRCIGDGLTIGEAYRSTGISVSSIRALLYRRTGTSRWPVQSDVGAVQ